jgi:cyclopropane-fatty-acyl-phospholipid synthase
MTKVAVEHSSDGVSLWTHVVSRFVEWVGFGLLGKPAHGSVTVVLPNGRSRTLGSPDGTLHSVLKLNNFKVIGAAMRRGTLGFASAYINGDIDIDDLTALFRFFVKNRTMFDSANPGLFRRAAQDIAYHMSRRNTKEGSKQNISEHYDLGNDFYGEWLDPSMTYSSAVFNSGDQSLEEAQKAKYHLVADMAGVKSGEKVLEIGCGWGGFAETVARDYGAELYGITLSAEQLKYAQDRIARQGLDNLATLHFEDYRDTVGQYDHIGSIEMIEAVGEDHWPTYYKAVIDRLKPGGTAAIQAITITEEDFPGYKAAPDFIQRYIFPGGMLLTKTAMREQGRRVGLLLENVQTFGLSYAKTLALWRERFLERWNVIAPLGYDEAFRRKWVYYLSYCEAGFTEGIIDVGVYQYRKPA